MCIVKFFIALSITLSVNCYASLTPIARVDVVPFQRITSTLNFGVIAFSKAGIEKVDITITGQGYSGGVKTTSSMQHNPDTNVYEYWVPISTSDFASDGVISIQADVIGKDGGSRTLGPLSFVVDKTGSLFARNAWVSTTGNDITGVVGAEDKPFLTISAALAAAQTANGGTADGCVVNVVGGSYTIGDLSHISTTNEFAIIKADGSVAAADIIFSGAATLPNSLKIKFDGVTLYSPGQYNYVISNTSANVWLDNVRIIGADRHLSGSNPLITNANMYYTNCYVYNVDRAIDSGQLARNLIIEHVGEDVFQNFPFAVNIRVTDQDPGETGWHADGYQSAGDGPNNRIIYGYYGKDMHYQGLFLRATNSPGKDNAFVNIFMEMREPGRDGGNGVVLSSGAIYGAWDHLLMWNCSFPKTSFYVTTDTSGYGFTNSSFIGNFFYEFVDQVAGFVDPAYASPGNSWSNDFLYNHYVRSYTDVTNCEGNQQPDGCPTWYSKSPDSSSDGTQTTGGISAASDQYLDVSNLLSTNFGAPIIGSVLIDGIHDVTVPSDATGARRHRLADVGAIEHPSTYLRLKKL